MEFGGRPGSGRPCRSQSGGWSLITRPSFLVTWLAEQISQLGSGLSGFALGIVVFRDTGSAVSFALVLVVTFLPSTLVSAKAGAVVDRVQRRGVMILANVGAALSMAILVLFLDAAEPQVRLVYVALAGVSIANGFKRPAVAAATTMLVPPDELVRANAMMSFGYGLSRAAAPALAVLLLATVGINGVVAIDAVSFLAAAGLLTTTSIPEPSRKAGASGRVRVAVRYLRDRPGLIGLLLLLLLANLVMAVASALSTPLVLSFGTEEDLGRIMSGAATAMLGASLLLFVWRGPESQVKGVLVATVAMAVSAVMIGLRASAVIIGLGFAGLMGAFPILAACNQALWQRKVDPAIQGRVFALRNACVWALTPLVYLVAGLAADRYFEPRATVPGNWVSALASLDAVGPGRGIAVIYMVTGLAVGMLAPLVFRLLPALGELEAGLPDHAPAAHESQLRATGGSI